MIKWCFIVVLLALACAAHQPHNQRRTYATPRRVNDATSVLLARLEQDVKKLLEEEENITPQQLTNIQGTWFSPTITTPAQSPLFVFLRANLAPADTTQTINWGDARIRYQSGTAMAAIGCRETTNDVDAWMFFESTVNAKQYNELGLRFTGNSNTLRKLPSGVSAGDVVETDVATWGLLALESSDPGYIYRIERFRGGFVALHHKNADNQETTYMWGSTDSGNFAPQRMATPTGWDDVELDIYFPSKQAYKKFWVPQSESPSHIANTEPYVTNSICLMMKSADVYKLRPAKKGAQDAADVCCLCGKDFPNNAGFQSHEQRREFCELMTRYASGVPKHSEVVDKCQGVKLKAVNHIDTKVLGQLSSFWDVKGGELKLLSKFLKDANYFNDYGSLRQWILQEAAKQHS